MGVVAPMIVAAFVDGNVSIVFSYACFSNSRPSNISILCTTFQFKTHIVYNLLIANGEGLAKCVFACKRDVFDICTCLDNLWDF